MLSTCTIEGVGAKEGLAGIEKTKRDLYRDLSADIMTAAENHNPELLNRWFKDDREEGLDIWFKYWVNRWDGFSLHKSSKHSHFLGKRIYITNMELLLLSCLEEIFERYKTNLGEEELLRHLANNDFAVIQILLMQHNVVKGFGAVTRDPVLKGLVDLLFRHPKFLSKTLALKLCILACQAGDLEIFNYVMARFKGYLDGPSELYRAAISQLNIDMVRAIKAHFPNVVGSQLNSAFYEGMAYFLGAPGTKGIIYTVTYGPIFHEAIQMLTSNGIPLEDIYNRIIQASSRPIFLTKLNLHQIIQSLYNYDSKPFEKMKLEDRIAIYRRESSSTWYCGKKLKKLHDEILKLPGKSKPHLSGLFFTRPQYPADEHKDEEQKKYVGSWI